MPCYAEDMRGAPDERGAVMLLAARRSAVI